MAALVSFYTDEPIKPPESEKRFYVDQRPLEHANEFEVGYPEPDVAYVRHPESSTRLIPLASFHSEILVEKTNEAILMLTALGASSIDLSYSNKISDQARADVEILFGPFSLGLGGGGSVDESSTVVYRATGSGAPPRELPPLLWMEQPGWRGIVEGRLHSGLREFALTFTYEHRSGVDAELVSRAKRFGLRAGGEFRKAHRVAFNLQGKFPETLEPGPAVAAHQRPLAHAL